MGGNSPKSGDTGQVGPKPSADATACQTSTQPDVPTWLFAGNNSVHAPVFGQLSERQSTSRKLPSMASSAFGTTNSKSPSAKTRATITANNTQSHAQPPQGSAQSAPSVALDTLNDHQALALLLKNQTVAGLLQNAFNTRVEKHQQKVERAYNQRLLELEKYTRSWRDTTKELWSAVGEGTLSPNNAQQECLTWKGPQEAGQGFNPEPPKDSQEIVEKEFDSDGRVACITVKHVSTSQSDSHFNLLSWTNSNGCGSKDFKAFAQQIPSWVQKGPPRLVFRHKTRFGTIKYRSFTSIDATVKKINKTDIIIKLTPSNVALLGRAFCYLKDTNDRIRPQANVICGQAISAAELSFLFERFSPEPTKQLIEVLHFFKGKKKIIPDIFAVYADVPAISGRLLVARPRYTIDGDISDTTFFDVGKDAYATCQDNDEDIILFEDEVTFNRLAALLCFSINSAIVPVSLGGTLLGPSLIGTSSDAGHKAEGFPIDQAPRRFSAVIVPNLTQGGPSQEWITDIKGPTTDFVSPSSNLLLLMKSHYLEDQEFSTFLKTPPSCGHIFFRLSDSVGSYKYLYLKMNKQSKTPELQREDIVVELTLQNMYLLWKAFCFLRDRNIYLLSEVAGPLSEVSRKALDDLHDKLHQHYRNPLPPKRQKRTMRCVLLPENPSPGGGIYDNQAEGVPFNRRLVIARPYHKGMRVIGAEFFDTGSGSRKARVSAEDMVITEETITLRDIGRILEKAIEMDVCPSTEQRNRAPASKGLAPPRPTLFQRTLDLSSGLQELRDESGRDQSHPQARSQLPTIGGEPQVVRSPSPKRQHERIADNQSQARGVEKDVLPFGPNNQHVHDVSSDDSENSDLIMLDKQPKNIMFRCRRKRPLPAAGQKAQMAKRPKLSKAEPSTVFEKQLPQNDPRVQVPQAPNLPARSFARPERLEKERSGEAGIGSTLFQADRDHTQPHTTSTSKHQVLLAPVPRAQSTSLGGPHSLESSSPLFLQSETIARRTAERRELREQLRQLGCRIEDDFDQAGERTVGGNTESSGQLQADGAFGQVKALSETAPSHQLREKLRRIGCRFEDDIDKVGESNNIGKVAKIEQLRESTERLEPMPETQRQIENTQANLRPAAHLPSFSSRNQTMMPLGDSNSPFTTQERVINPLKILTNQSESTPVQGDNMSNLLISGPQVSSVDEKSPRATLAGLGLPPRTIPTEPKAFRGVPKEPRAMRPALPQQHSTCSPPVAYPATVSVDPIFQHQSPQENVSLSNSEEPKRSEEEYMGMAMTALEEEDKGREEEQIRITARKDAEKRKEKHIAEVAANDAELREQELELERVEETQMAGQRRLAAAPKGSLALPNQVHAAHFVNPFAMAGRRSVMPIGLWDHNTHRVPEFPRSADSNEDEGEVE